LRKDLLRKVKEEFDWDGYVREHHTVKWTPNNELRICCLVCGDDKYKLYVNPVKRLFNCFKCNFKSGNYDVFDFVSATEGITRFQAMGKLIREYAAVTPEDGELEKQLMAGFAEEEVESLQDRFDSIKTLDSLPKDLVPLTGCNEESEPFWNYLVGRGLTPKEIVAIQAHYSPKSFHPVFDSNGKLRGNLTNRVVVPVYGGQNKLVSWQGRSIDSDDDMKYLTAPESELSKTLWPFVKPHDKHAVLVEGVYDCLAVRRIPGVSAYATFTKKISIDQMLRLRMWGIEEVTLFWDKKDAKREMERAIPELLMHFKKVYVLRLKDWPTNTDAGNMLADSAGTDKLKAALQDRVDIYDALEFAKWKIEF
jgi:DNA primase